MCCFLEAEQIHNFSHPWEANWFCCCSRRQRLTQFVFCEWHFWLFFGPNQHRLRFPTTTRGPQGEIFCKISRPDGGETLGDPGLNFATPESFLKMCSHDERNLRTHQFVLRNPTSCSFKAPSRSSQREKNVGGGSEVGKGECPGQEHVTSNPDSH